MTQGAPFPAALPNDSEDVSWALSTAQAMWTRGDQAEAVKWVKRASDSAADAGDDDRAFDLARAAAELRNAEPPADAPPPSQTPAAIAAPTPEPPRAVVPMPPGTPKPASVAPPPPPRKPASVAPAPIAKRVPPPPAARATPAARVPAPPPKAEAAPEPEKPAPAAPAASKFGFPFPIPGKAVGTPGRPVGNLRPPTKDQPEIKAPPPVFGLIDDDEKTNLSQPVFAPKAPAPVDDEPEQEGSPEDWDTVAKKDEPAPAPAAAAPPPAARASGPVPTPSGEVSSPVIGALRVWVVPAGNGQHKMVAARGARPSGAVEGLFVPTDDFDVRLLAAGG